MKRKKGFTLIELLAVIVILAIIALITVPMIVGVIEKAGKGAFLDSAYGVLDTLKLEYINKAANNDTKGNFVYTFPSSGLKISGKEPGGGRANMDTNGKVELAIWDDDKKWCATKADNEETITLVDYVDGACKVAEPILRKDFLQGTGFSIVDIASIDIVVSREVPEDALKSWDASEAGNGSVMAWVYKDKEDQTKYNLYIGGNGLVYAPEDSSFLFRSLSITTSCLKRLNVRVLNTSKVTNMERMFQYANKITELDVSGFETGNVTNMAGMFLGCSLLENLDVSHFDTSNVTSMGEMFSGCTNLVLLDVSNFNTNKVTSMANMFNSCRKLIRLDVGHFNTSKVVSTVGMFGSCWKLESLDVSRFDTSNVVNMSEMFSDCTNLVILDVSHFNTSKVVNMAKMFSDCFRLENIDVSRFNTSNVINMSYMFKQCIAVDTLNLANFDTSNVTNMSYMFYQCQGFTSLNITNFDTSNVTNMYQMFKKCNYVRTLSLGKFDTSKVTNSSLIFADLLDDVVITVQNQGTKDWILALSEGHRPSSWTSANVVIG